MLLLFTTFKQANIKMKDFYTYAEIGERYDDYALAWDKIPAVPYAAVNTVSISTLQRGLEARLQNNRNYQLMQESALWKENLDKEESISLNQTKFNEVMKTRKAQIEKFKEYRQSVISETVTGKIDVRNWQPNKNK